MYYAFLNINGVQTKVLTFGRWVEESPKSKQPEDIILVIPGNPGYTGFYKMFMQIIHEKTNCSVWIIGHAGHEIEQNSPYKTPALKGNETLYGLQGQIEHKIEFIKKYVPETARLHLIGHSIGAYMILESLKDKAVGRRVANIILLFPAIEHMAEVPNAKFYTKYVKCITWLILFLAFIFTILPKVLAKFLISFYLDVRGLPKNHLDNIINLVNPSTMEKVFFLAFETFDQVRDRNNSIIKKYVKKIKFIYSVDDKWAPVKYGEKLVADIPDINAEACLYKHSFYYKQSQQVADLVKDSIITTKRMYKM